MPRRINSKTKILELARIFYEQTDVRHGLTLSEISALLAEKELPAERKTLYDDFETLRSFGMDIVAEKDGRDTRYKLVTRTFEPVELKLMVDTVLSAKFITDKKSRELIKKIASMASCHEAVDLQRDVVFSGRIKTMNESIYYNVDRIHRALLDGAGISFLYWQWNVQKKPELRHGGARYNVLPRGLVWDDENYYLIATLPEEENLRHFRVDKMKDIRLNYPKAGEKRERAPRLDLPKYSRSLFGMFGGEQTEVIMECEDTLIGPIIDRFGKEIELTPLGKDRFRARVTVCVSDQFIGWIVGLGPGIRIVSPADVTARFRGTGERLLQQYGRQRAGQQEDPLRTDPADSL